MVVDQLTELDTDRLFHALADATRRDIVRRVLVGEQSISDLARRYPMSMTAVQKHVAVLERAGLVSKHRSGREQRVTGRFEGLQRAQRLLDAYEQEWRDRFDRIGDLLAETRQEDPDVRDQCAQGSRQTHHDGDGRVRRQRRTGLGVVG